jgi:hypothetical protein
MANQNASVRCPEVCFKNFGSIASGRGHPIGIQFQRFFTGLIGKLDLSVLKIKGFLRRVTSKGVSSCPERFRIRKLKLIITRLAKRASRTRKASIAWRTKHRLDPACVFICDLRNFLVLNSFDVYGFNA